MTLLTSFKINRKAVIYFIFYFHHCIIEALKIVLCVCNSTIRRFIRALRLSHHILPIHLNSRLSTCIVPCSTVGEEWKTKFLSLRVQNEFICLEKCFVKVFSGEKLLAKACWRVMGNSRSEIFGTSEYMHLFKHFSLLKSLPPPTTSNKKCRYLN